MRMKKIASKRLTLHKKHSIRKKAQERRRKRIKEAKKNPKRRQRSSNADRIPNSWPFKEQILERQAQKKFKVDVTEIRRQAEVARNIFEENQKKAEESVGYHDGSMSSFYREFKKVVENSDVILEVLDARDPLGTRCKAIEKQILEKYSQKKIVLVLNKIDLIPKDNLTEWLKYLRREYPAVAFKSAKKAKSGKNTNLENNFLVSSDGYTQCLGAKTLMSLLKNYSRINNVKRTITVGIIGIPNVGKSSLINSLKREQCVLAGSTPGSTKVAQEIALDTHIKLFDSPGIIFTKCNSEAEAALRNTISIPNIKDVFTPIQMIMSKCTAEQLAEIYQIEMLHDMNDFLNIIARRYGKLKAHGVPNINAAARLVIQDWCKGNIPYYSKPPKIDDSQISAAIVNEWGKEFNIDEVESLEAKRVLQMLPEKNAFEYIKIQPSNPLDVNPKFKAFRENPVHQMDTDEKDVSNNTEEQLKPTLVGRRVKRQLDPIYACNLRINQMKKDARRKKLRQIKKLVRVSMGLLPGAQAPPNVESSEEYNFGKDFWENVPTDQVREPSNEEEADDYYNM